MGLLAAPAAAEKLVVYGDDAYAPVIYLHQSKAAGIIPAILSRLQKDTGDTYDLVLVPWKRAVLESERQGGGITGISRNQVRDQFYDFSLPIYDDDIHLVVLKGREFVFKDLADLRGKFLGGALGASYGGVVDAAIDAGVFTVDRDPKQQVRLHKLLLGRMDAAIVGNGIGGLEHLIASDPELQANRSRFVMLPQPLVRDPLHLAFAKSMHKTAALDRFNKALVKFKKSPEYLKLIGETR